MNRIAWLPLLAILACSETPPAEKVPEGEEAPAAESPAAAPQAEPAARAPETPPAPDPSKAPEPPPPVIVEVEVPAGTVLELELLTALDSSINQAGDEIQARTLSPVFVEGEQVLEPGALLEGKVTEAKASGRVKGRATLGFTFDRLDTPGGRKKIRTSYVAEQAGSGKKKDAAIIGGAAGVGAIVGGIIGGKKGAAIGAGVGGAGGTGVVLSTKGAEVKLPVGSRVNVRLDDPVSITLKKT